MQRIDFFLKERERERKEEEEGEEEERKEGKKKENSIFIQLLCFLRSDLTQE